MVEFVDDRADRTLEILGQLQRVVAALGPCGALVPGSFGAQALDLDQTFAQHTDRLGHAADLVGARTARHLDIRPARRDRVERAGKCQDRPRDAAREEEADHHRQGECGKCTQHEIAPSLGGRGVQVADVARHLEDAEGLAGLVDELARVDGDESFTDRHAARHVLAVEGAPHLAGRQQRAFGSGAGGRQEAVAVDHVERDVRVEFALHPLDKRLGDRHPDIEGCDNPAAVTQRHGREQADILAGRLDAGRYPSVAIGLDDRHAAGGHVVTEGIGRVGAVQYGSRRLGKHERPHAGGIEDARANRIENRCHARTVARHRRIADRRDLAECCGDAAHDGKLALHLVDHRLVVHHDVALDDPRIRCDAIGQCDGEERGTSEQRHDAHGENQAQDERTRKKRHCPTFEIHWGIRKQCVPKLNVELTDHAIRPRFSGRK